MAVIMDVAGLILTNLVTKCRDTLQNNCLLNVRPRLTMVQWRGWNTIIIN